MSDAVDLRAAIYSILIPGLGQLIQRRYGQAATAALCTVVLVGASLLLGRVSDRAAEVFFFMILALPWWALQSYDAYLGSAADGSEWRRTFRTSWRRGHDIRFLGLLLLISAVNDTVIIVKNFDYLLPFYCTKFSGIPGFLTKAISPVLHLAVGYGFVRLARWAFLVYLIYAAYGFTNGMVNLACFGPGRIRNTLLAAVVLSTIYIVWRRSVLLKPASK
ncbi:MAG TPA: hypothetical protein VJR03_16540 [Nitrospira sp.]|nr:hypothetical protein [Nitrospira sp.]